MEKSSSLSGKVRTVDEMFRPIPKEDEPSPWVMPTAWLEPYPPLGGRQNDIIIITVMGEGNTTHLCDLVLEGDDRHADCNTIIAMICSQLDAMDILPGLSPSSVMLRTHRTNRIIVDTLDIIRSRIVHLCSAKGPGQLGKEDDKRGILDDLIIAAEKRGKNDDDDDDDDDVVMDSGKHDNNDDKNIVLSGPETMTTDKLGSNEAHVTWRDAHGSLDFRVNLGATSGKLTRTVLAEMCAEYTLPVDEYCMRQMDFTRHAARNVIVDNPLYILPGHYYLLEHITKRKT